MIKKALLIYCFLFISSCSLGPLGFNKKCLQKRGAFDIGSGSTKVTFALVDLCSGKIKEILFEDSAPFKFKATLKANNNYISPLLYQSALKKLLSWKKIGEGLKVESLEGAATEVFRQALNGPDTIKNLKKDTGINIKLIDQKQEARLGHLAAVSTASLTPENVVMWDIGGASMQLVTIKDGKQLIHLGKTASVSFKERISGDRTPNPLRPVGAKAATTKARKIALLEMNEAFLSEMKKRPKEFIGIGGVHYHSLGKKLLNEGKDYYDQKSLERALLKYSNFKDYQIKGAYRQTEVTNMALVLGFMQAMSVEKVYPRKINLAHGLLLAKMNNE